MNVFLSYSSSDLELAERLAYSLRDEGYSVFFDRTSLPPGEGYHSHIRSAIERCNLFIFLISHESVSRGSYALTELGVVQHKWGSPSGRILPVMVSEIDLATLPPYLKTVTVLRPQGEVVPEVVAVVNRLRLLDAEPVKVSGSLSNAGWLLSFDILGYVPIKEIFYRFADEDTFKSTGFTQVRDPRTGLVGPKLYAVVPLFKGTQTLLVKYTDSAGSENGPYTLLLDAVEQIVAWTKDALEILGDSWVGFREYPEGRMLLYFTNLVSHKNSLKEIQYSVDNESLSRRVRFTPDWSGLGAPKILDDDETVVEIPMSARFVVVKLVFIDGSEWPARRFAGAPGRVA
jgi:hypothetical protein